MSRQNSPPKPVAQPDDPLDLSSSVAGEEDPGASFDAAPPLSEPRRPQPGGPVATAACPQCGGTGRIGASSCATCQGTGKVVDGTGSA